MMKTEVKSKIKSKKIKDQELNPDEAGSTNTRLATARLIYKEVAKYLSNKGYSCHYEVGLNKWGKLRADVLAFNYKQEVIIVEVKSCWQDYKTDTKFLGYLDFCHKFYFAVSQDFPLKAEFLAKLKEHKIGLLIVDLASPRIHLFHSRSIQCGASARLRSLDKEISNKIILRLAYRSGKLRTNKQKWMTG